MPPIKKTPIPREIDVLVLFIWIIAQFDRYKSKIPDSGILGSTEKNEIISHWISTLTDAASMKKLLAMQGAFVPPPGTAKKLHGTGCVSEITL